MMKFEAKPVLLILMAAFFLSWPAQAENTNGATTNDTVRLRVTVVDSVILVSFAGPLTWTSDIKPNFALTLRIDSCVPAITNLKSGSFVTFAVHSPTLFLGGNAEKGQTNEIAISPRLAANLILSDTEEQAHKAEFYHIDPGMPEISVHLTFPYATTAEWYRNESAINADKKAFTDVIRKFALTNEVPNCQNQPSGYMGVGPPLCSFKGKRFQILTQGGIRSTHDCFMFILSPISMAPDEFNSQTDYLLKSLEARFPDRLKIKHKIW